VPTSSTFIPFLDGFKRYPEAQFLFIQGEAVSINFVHRKLEVKVVMSRSSKAEITDEIQDITYHALIIATGASSHSELLSLHGSHEKTLKVLKQFHRDLNRASSLIIVGGGPSGVECAGQIATWDIHRKRRKSRSLGLKRSKKSTPEMEESKNSLAIRITLISGHDHLLPELGPKAGAKAERQLKELGVHIINNVRLVSAQQLPSRVTRCVLSNGMILSGDLLISATGQTPNTAFLPKEILDDNSYVAVDQRFMRVMGAGERVYAVGSCCSIEKNTLRDIFRSIPVLIHNLRNDLQEFEIKIQNTFGGRKNRSKALRDIYFHRSQSVTQLCHITRWGGVGMLYGWSIPSFVVWLLKRREYRLSKARSIVSSGRKPGVWI
jgi:NADH dehydrogenase FAD-containing subunit